MAGFRNLRGFLGTARPQKLSDVLPAIILCVPAITLLAFWTGGEIALLGIALGIPLLVLCVAFLTKDEHGRSSALQGPMSEQDFVAAATASLEAFRHEEKKSAAIFVRIDEFEDLKHHHGNAAMQAVMAQASARFQSCLRDNDIFGRFSDDGFAICLAAQTALDLEICLQIAGRLNRAAAEPYSVDGTRIYLTASVGFCQLGREGAGIGHSELDSVLSCAIMALDNASSAAPGSIRAYTHEQRGKAVRRAADKDENALNALENGEIVAWFQPQVSTDTGRITGFETLARWNHPARGTILPTDFLPQIEAANLMGRLSEIMIHEAFTAIRKWDKAGQDIGQVGVNFSPAELNDPKLVEKLTWEFDRFELSADRLAVEILETVVSNGPDDVISRNIRGLRDLGCMIDLDDFGTGHASLSSIRRFGVGRIKIDRSFVMKADRDADQQRMIRAILTMAEKLNLETLAEGVETVGEHSLLAQLGCTHVQGFGIGRPMPFDQTLSWIRSHNQKVQPIPGFGNSAG